MLQALLAGCAYVALVFAAGFALGILRVLVLIPALARLGLGEVTAIAIELPIILTFAWIACRRLLRAFRVPPSIGARLTMGGIAFGLLMTAELGFAVLFLGRSPANHLVRYGELPTLLGLVGQLAFAAFPVMQGRQGA